MMHPVDLISWTGWTKEDYKEFLLDLTIFCLKQLTPLVCTIIAIIYFLINGANTGYFIMLGIMIFLVILSISFGYKLERFVYERGESTIGEGHGGESERPSKPSESLHIEDRSGIDNRYQVFYRGSSGVRSGGHSKRTEVSYAMETQKRTSRPEKSQVVYR